MSDHKPITGELRANVCTESFAGRQPSVVRMEQERFDRLCDAIDAIHAGLERENERLRCELDRVRGKQEDHRSCIYYDPERHYCSCHDIDTDGMVELPKDADGEYIHVGDVMEWCDSGDTLEVIGIGDDTLFYIDPEGDRTYAEWTAARNKRHHHAPTVEDVLREFAEKITDSQIPSVHPTYEEAIAEYVAKLQLAGDAE